MLFLLVLGISDFYWMRTHTPLPLWGELLILSPVTFVLGFIGMCWRHAARSVETPPRRFAGLLLVLAGCLAYFVSQRYAKFLVLISLYGCPRVLADHLHFVSTEKAVPWVVSNGDHLTDAEHLWGDIDSALMSAVFFPTCLLIFPLLPRRKI
jgi:hypothetical protein